MYNKPIDVHLDVRERESATGDTRYRVTYDGERAQVRTAGRVIAEGPPYRLTWHVPQTDPVRAAVAEALAQCRPIPREPSPKPVVQPTPRADDTVPETPAPKRKAKLSPQQRADAGASEDSLDRKRNKDFG